MIYQLPRLREVEGRQLLRWATDLIAALRVRIDKIDRLMPNATRIPVNLRVVVLANLPKPAGQERLLILNEGGGVRSLLYSDGVTWRRARNDSAL